MDACAKLGPAHASIGWVGLLHVIETRACSRQSEVQNEVILMCNLWFISHQIAALKHLFIPPHPTSHPSPPPHFYSAHMMCTVRRESVQLTHQSHSRDWEVWHALWPVGNEFFTVLSVMVSFLITLCILIPRQIVIDVKTCMAVSWEISDEDGYSTRSMHHYNSFFPFNPRVAFEIVEN